MSRSSPPRGYQGGYLVGFVVIAVVAARLAILHRSDLLAPTLLLASYSVLYCLEPRLSGHFAAHRLLYFPLQTGIVIALTNLHPFTDISTTLYIPLGLQVMRSLPRRAAAIALAAYACLISATLLLGMAWAEALALLLLSLAFGAFLISYDRLYWRMETDQAESERNLEALQTAHRQLQGYAAQAEELAAERERNRLARELHDSISQAVFSVRLTAQSARILLDREPARVPEQVDRLQAMTAEALAQLRSLIAQLRPPRDT